MSKKETPAMPDPPSFQEDERFTSGLEDLFGLGNKLTSFDFEGDLSPLKDLISTNPETTKLFLQGLNAQLDPQFRDAKQSIMNDLAANNQLESSVTGNRLSQLESDRQNMLLQQSTAFGLSDIDRAMQSRMSLFGTGLNTLSGATGMAQSQGNALNQFNLSNYDNQIAKWMDDSNRATSLGFWGSLGASMSPLYHDIASAQGYSNVPGMGTQEAVLNTISAFGGGGLYRSPSGGANYMAGSSASNNPFQGTSLRGTSNADFQDIYSLYSR